MASKELTREALVNLATPFFEVGKEVFIALCPKGKLYVGDVPSETCEVCDTTHPNHSAKSLKDLPDPGSLDVGAKD